MTIKPTIRAVVLSLSLAILPGTPGVLAQGNGTSSQPPAGSNSTSTVQIKMQIPDLGGAAIQGIDVFSYDFQSSNIGSTSGGGGGGAGKVEFGPLTIGKRIDSLSPAISQRNFTGQHLREVTLRWFRADSNGKLQQPLLTVKLSDVLISSIHTKLPNQLDPAAAALGEIEEVSFTFADIEVTAGV